MTLKAYKKTKWRDRKKCQRCGGSENLTVHHIKPQIWFKNNPDFKGMKNNLDNLITLCRRCHTELHQKDDPKNMQPTWIQKNPAQ